MSLIKRLGLFIILLVLLSLNTFCVQKDLKNLLIKLEQIKEPANKGIVLNFKFYNKKDNTPFPFTEVRFKLKESKEIVFYSDIDGTLEVGFYPISFISDKIEYLEFYPQIYLLDNKKHIVTELNFKIIEKNYQADELPTKVYEKIRDNDIEKEMSFLIDQDKEFLEILKSKSKAVNFIEYKADSFNIDFPGYISRMNYMVVEKENEKIKLKGITTFLVFKKDTGTEPCFIYYFTKEELVKFFFNENLKKDIDYEINYNPIVFDFNKGIFLERPNVSVTKIFSVTLEVPKYSILNIIRIFLSRYNVQYFFIDDKFLNRFHKTKLTDKYNVYYALKSQKKDVNKFKNFLFTKLKFLSKEFNYKFNVINDYFIFKGLNKHFIWLNKNHSFRLINFSEDDYLTEIHEIVKGSILLKSNFYKNDKYTRWIVDGVAEYARYKCFKKLHPKKNIFIVKKFFGLMEIKKISIRELRGNKKYFDLRKFKAYESMGEVEGINYSEMDVIAMYFWYKITNKCGDQIIGEFLNEAAKLDKPTNKELVPLLSEITGMDIDKELNVNLEEVVEYVNNN